MDDLPGPLLRWYDEHARDLPWRSASATPWSVMVSEFMLQQTPVSRVLPVHALWLARWPTPPTSRPSRPARRSGCGAGSATRGARSGCTPRRSPSPSGTAAGAGRPRRLRALPGVGEYTAAAVAVFAFGHRHPVLDTNVRRVLARVVAGSELPPASLTRAERDRASGPAARRRRGRGDLVGRRDGLGALVCTAGRPRCNECPLADRCAWRAAGYPAYDGPVRRGQAWAGTDRQCRGRLMAAVRDADGPVTADRLARTWDEADQRTRCLAGLVEDGLLVRSGAGYALP